jgi:hypothetical protein
MTVVMGMFQPSCCDIVHRTDSIVQVLSPQRMHYHFGASTDTNSV